MMNPHFPRTVMRKFSLLLGALGGVLGGYLLSNEKLRTELLKAKDPEAAARTLGKHLQRDGKKVASEVTKFVESDDVQKNLTKAKKFAMSKFDEAKKGVESLVKKGTKGAKGVMKKSVGKKKAKTGFSEERV